jgi:hypothetical protein
LTFYAMVRSFYAFNLSIKVPLCISAVVVNLSTWSTEKLEAEY